MNIEDLVPPLELCGQIPYGYFTDSVFAWWHDVGGQTLTLHLRNAPVNNAERYVIFAPAPTLAEIMADLAKFGKKAEADCIFDHWKEPLFSADYYAGSYTHIGHNAAEEALKVWFDVRKAEGK